MAFEEYLEFGQTGSPSEANYGKLARFVYSDTLHAQVREKLLFTRQGFVGPDIGMEDPQDNPLVAYPIMEKTELGKGRGAHIEFPLIKSLTGAATLGTTTLVDSGNEEAFAFSYFKAYVETMRHATGYVGDISEVRNPFLSEEIATQQLTKWLADQEEDSVFDAFVRGHSSHVISGLSTVSQTYFVDEGLKAGDTTQATGDTTHPNWMFAGDATDEESIDSADTLDAAELEKLGAYAEVNKWNKIRVPDGVGGFEEGFILLIHPFNAYDLRQDTVWAQAQREANVRDWKNPIFSGSLGMYNGIFLYKSTKVENGGTGITSRTSKRRCIFFGAHALAKAIAIPERITRRKEDDYENVKGWAISKTFGYARADWTDDTETPGTAFNQSSLILSTWAAQPYTVAA